MIVSHYITIERPISMSNQIRNDKRSPAPVRSSANDAFFKFSIFSTVLSIVFSIIVDINANSDIAVQVAIGKCC